MMSKNKPYGFIYKTILPDGRFYIGQHKIVSHKTLDPNYFGSGVIIKDFIKSIGKQSLTREILSFGYSVEEMNLLEAQLVTKEVIQNPLCINLDIGGRHKYTRYGEVNQKISETMSKIRSLRKDSWGSLRGEKNNFAKKWLLISPDGEKFEITGTLNEFCLSKNISPNTIKAAIRGGWIPRRGSCKGWQGFDLKTGRGTVRDTMNHGDAIKGINNPSSRAKLRRIN